RRRHTRFSRDWSSDVCSSDLIEDSLNHLRRYLAELVTRIRGHAEQVAGASRSLADVSAGLHGSAERQARDTAQISDALGELEARSEERRVGKECAYGGATERE